MTKIIQKTNPKFSPLISFIKNRCNKEGFVLTNFIEISYDNYKTITSFTLLDKKRNKIKTIELYPLSDICTDCGSFDTIKVITLTNTQTNVDCSFKDCIYCYKKLEDVLIKSKTIEYRTSINSPYTSNVFLPGNQSIPPRLLFKKAYEHYKSAKSLINDPLTIEQAVVNYSECLEKILKGIGLIYKVTTPPIHNLKELYNCVQRSEPSLKPMNQHLLIQLTEAYHILRYKEQKMPLNSRLFINATRIEIEVDFIISNFLNPYLDKSSFNHPYLTINEWTRVKQSPNFLFPNDSNFSILMKQKGERYLSTCLIKENSYFLDPNTSRHFHLDKSYQIRGFQTDFFSLKKSISTNYSNEIQNTTYPKDNTFSFRLFINNDEYIKL